MNFLQTASIHRTSRIRVNISTWAIGFISTSLALLFPVWPSGMTIPLAEAITSFFAWFSSSAKPVTRLIGFLLAQPLHLVEVILFRGINGGSLLPLPWALVFCGMLLFAHWAGGMGLATLVGLSTLYLAFFGLWVDSMKTLSLVIVIVPIATILGFVLGLWALRSSRVERTMNAVLDVMQATPHMAYLAPMVVLYGFGNAPAMLATIGFALPPMARLTVVGLRGVSSEIVEAGVMAGCSPMTLLFKVRLPAARHSLMMGLNQVVMQTLAMVVIASLVGVGGLGQRLLFSLQQLQVGKALEQGIAITLIAIVVDRSMRALVQRRSDPNAKDRSRVIRHWHGLGFFLALLILPYVALRFPELANLPKTMTLSFSTNTDEGVRWLVKNSYIFIQPIREFATTWILLPIRGFWLQLPWPLFIGGLALLGYRFGGSALALLPVILFGSLLVTGFWEPLMLTVYLIFAATTLCIIIGIPIGLAAAHNQPAARIILSVCDILQTFPSFIYLIPVIMLLQTSDLSNVIAIVLCAVVPAIRYTYLGVRYIPAEVTEASIALGTTRLQRLRKIELPLAFPEILLGVNQTILTALSMIAITALIGSRDLGQEIYKALPTANTGRALIAGLGIAFIGISADRLIGAWATSLRRRSSGTM